MGPLVAQTIFQRALYVRTKIKFKLSWEYCVLDPMDIVTITDANLGLSNFPVRIVEIEEDDQGLLAITAEELVFGVSSPAFYPNASAAGSYQQNTGVPAVAVNPPLIVQPPLALTNGARRSGSALGRLSGTLRSGAARMSTSRPTEPPIRRWPSSRRRCVRAFSRPRCRSRPAGTRSARWRSTWSKAAGRSPERAPAAASTGATLSLVDGEFLAYETATLVSAPPTA